MTNIDEKLISCIFKISRFMRDSASHHKKIASLTLLQMQVLVYVKKHTDISMREIAQEFHIEMPSATSLINTLVKDNFVVRHTDIKDRRLVKVALTKKGNTLLEKTLQEKCQRMQKNLSYLSGQDKKNLLNILEKIVHHMEEEK